eukprot:jgi/Chlat1/5182/Chrsp33S05159
MCLSERDVAGLPRKCVRFDAVLITADFGNLYDQTAELDAIAALCNPGGSYLNRALLYLRFHGQWLRLRQQADGHITSQPLDQLQEELEGIHLGVYFGWDCPG